MKEKGRFLKKHRGTECLNCGIPLDIIDKYCHNCGQINTNKRLSLKDFFDEFFASILSYDSRLSHTIITLLFNPGKISKEYIEGKRIRYANPFRFYLSVSIIFFIINGLFIDFNNFKPGIEDQVTKGKKALNEIEDNVSLDSLKQKINNEISEAAHLSESDKKIINDKILEIEGLSLKDKKKPKSKEATYYSQKQIDSNGFIQKTFMLWPVYDDYYDRTGEKSADRALSDLKHKKSQLNKYVYQRVLKVNEIEENYGQEFFEFIFNKLPFIIFFFLPFLAIAIWLIYIRRSFTYMEHLVFTFHTQTLFFILMGITILINKIIGNEIATKFSYLTFLIYLLLALKKFYNQKWGKTIVKFLLVNVLFFILAGLGSVIILVGSIFIF